MSSVREQNGYERELDDNAASSVTRSGPSQRAVFYLLERLTQGFIRLRDGGAVHTFGDEFSDLKVDIEIHDSKFYRRLLIGGSIGAAESYIEGQWSTPQLTELIQIFARNLSVLQQHEKRFSGISNLFQRVRHGLVNRNSKAGSRTNIAAHYDLSNDFYRLFLDPDMQYSSAIFPNADATLEQAQQHKMRLLCDRLGLTEEDHLLEVGTGWGGLACFAARHYGCKVTTTTISKAQYEIAQQRIVDQQLEGQVTLLLDDYRDLQGQYSKIVSVEMIEAVGHEFMPEYFRLLNSLLAPGGKLVIQAITIEDQRYEDYRKSPDFIQRYIFPGGHLPSISEICRHVKEQTNMRLVSMSDYGHDYADTLKIWNERFAAQCDEVEALGFTHDFMRLWQYYFCYCEGAFRENVIGLAHIETEKSRHAQ